MRFLVLGAGGMAGHVISIYLKESGHEVMGFARRRLDYTETIVADAANLEFVRGVIQAGGFDAVVNAIGILNQDAEEHPARAALLNGYYPHFLAEITDKLQTQIIHMSTDCVFSGKNGNYEEHSLRDGESFYDRSKAFGELEDGKNLTLRNSIVGPDINPGGIGLLHWFLRQKGMVKGYTKVMWTGMTTLQLAKIIEKAAKQRASGLYHMVPDHKISKYELLRLFNHYFRADSIQIQPCEKIQSDKSLRRTNYAFAETVPDYERMVCELASWMQTHKSLYPHYVL